MRKLLFGVIWFLTSCAMLLTFSGGCFAAEETVGILVSPSSVDYGTLKPGEVYSSTFELQNSGTTDYEYEVSVDPYSVIGSGGKNTANLKTGSEYTVVKDWLSFDKPNGALKVGQRTQVKFTITVPSDAPGGAQSAIVIIKAREPEGVSSGGVTAVKSVGTVVYGNIAGETREKAEIVSNSVPMFMFEGPIKTTAKVKNEGNVYIDVKQHLEIRSFFGDELVYTNENDALKNHFAVFPGVEVENAVTWEEAPKMGVFKVKQVVEVYGEVVETEKLLILCPVWFLLMILAFVALLIWLIVGRIRMGKKLKARQNM